LGFLLTLFTAATAASLEARSSPTAISSAQINSYTPYTWYANAAYCSSIATSGTWDCGEQCNANPNFQLIASGGDGSDVQYWYVGYDPSLGTIIVAHQGTDPSQFEALLTDAEIAYSSLSSSLFPGVSSSVEVDDGFQGEQALTAADVLSAVQAGLSIYGTKKVTIVGHSLGAALALIDAVYLPLHLPGVTFNTITYSMPRVGNQAFANYVDANVKLTHINNLIDPIPICPGRFLGYVHPSGEIHISENGNWYACPGQDNTSNLCIVGDVPNIFDGSISDHDGPFNGITMGC